MSDSQLDYDPAVYQAQHTEMPLEGIGPRHGEPFEAFCERLQSYATGGSAVMSGDVFGPLLRSYNEELAEVDNLIMPASMLAAVRAIRQGERQAFLRHWYKVFGR